MKDKLPWFKHENNARNSGGAMALRAQYGFEGYGRYQALKEIMADQPGARLDLSLKMNRASYALELRLKPEEFEVFLGFLSDPDECGLLRCEGGVYRSEEIDRDFARVERKRDGDRVRPEPESETGSEKAETGSEKAETGSDLSPARERERKKEQQPRARDDLPDQDPEPDFDEAAFAAWVAGLERVRQARSPRAMARKLMTEPDVREEFRASRAPPPPEPLTSIPAPRDDCGCGGHLLAAEDRAQCVACGAFYAFDYPSRTWVPDDDDGGDEPAEESRGMRAAAVYAPRAGPLAAAVPAKTDAWEKARKGLKLERMVL